MFERSIGGFDASLNLPLAVQAFPISVVLPCGTRSASGWETFLDGAEPAREMVAIGPTGSLRQ